MDSFGFDYGMELNLYASHFLDGCPVVSGTKTKSYEHLSQIFWYLTYTFLHTWAQEGVPFFRLREIF